MLINECFPIFEVLFIDFLFLFVLIKVIAEFYYQAAKFDLKCFGRSSANYFLSIPCSNLLINFITLFNKTLLKVN